VLTPAVSAIWVMVTWFVMEAWPERTQKLNPS
jgi:hypothetical protein